MDNRRDLPGYKSYRLRGTGERAPVFVAFLEIVGSDGDGAAVNGVRSAAPSWLSSTRASATTSAPT
jgi:hypothetical protein